MTLTELKERLLKGNQPYVASVDLAQKREETSLHGQHPFVCVITCSDSRVIPEEIFHCSIGDIFTIRVAGNVIDEAVLGSVEYATEHLGVPYVILLGHTHCGAVQAAIHKECSSHIGALTLPIMRIIKDEKDEEQAVRKNIFGQIDVLKEKLDCSSFTLVPALYDIEKGKVEFLS